ncbi:MAG TPA: polymer-forming cytoskeletal protein [Clostridia bacterium]|nr:polymer-forming cytoskeletal protein [Clostridia bacterium]
MNCRQGKITSNRNSSGSSLIMVLIIFAMFLMLSAALLSAAFTSTAMAGKQVTSQQNYLSARSANASLLKVFTDSTNSGWQALKDKIRLMTVGDTLTGEINDPNLGHIRIVITKTGSTTTGMTFDIKSTTILSDGTQSAPVILHLSAPITSSVVYDASNPYNSLFYYTGSVTHYMETGNATGMLIYNGPVYIAQAGGSNNNVKGNVFSTDVIYLSGSQTGITYLASNKDIFLQDTYKLSSNGYYYSDNNPVIGTSAVPCPVIAKGSLSVGGHYNSNDYPIIYGNVTVDGNVTLTDHCRIYGNITAGGAVRIDGGCTVQGNVVAGGGITGSGAVTGTKSPNTKNIPKVTIIYTPTDKLPAITPPAYSNAVAVGSGGTINTSGVLSSSSFNNSDTLYVDTSAADVNLVIKNDLTLGYSDWWNNYSQKILVSGSHNLYIYLASGSDLTLRSSSQIGMRDGTTGNVSSSTSQSGWPHIFIIGNNQTLTLNDTSLLRANIFLPNGTFAGNWSNGASSNNRFMGSALIGDDTIIVSSKSQSLYFLKPTLDNTPLSGFGTQKYAVGNYTGSWSK